MTLWLYIFTEEASMKEALNAILPKLGISTGSFKIIDFKGVGNLERSLERQLRAVSKPDARFLVLRDNDRGNCNDRKRRLLEMVAASGRQNQTKVRIVCQMLESWFIGDPEALIASKHLKKAIPNRLKTCDPDLLDDPKRELSNLRQGYGEISGARAIAPHLDLELNRSASFRNTIRAIRDLAAA